MSKFPPLRIDLTSRSDKNGQKYYIGKLESTVTLNLKKGTVFFVFNSEQENEELRIGKASPGTVCSSVKKSVKTDGTIDRYFIDLETKIDENQQTYYMAKVQDDNIEINFEEGYLFFAFTSIVGKETLQIVRKSLSSEKDSHEDIEVMYQNRKISGVLDMRSFHEERLKMTS